MKVTFYFNYLNNHMVHLADELYKLLGDDFKYVTTYPRNSKELKWGLDYSDRKYCIFASEDARDLALAHKLNLSSDVCIFGAGNLDWEKERASTGKLSFEISERWLKKGFFNLLSPRLLKWWWLYNTKLRNRPFFLLCASAYASKDCRILRTFKNRCYKWGYFTNVQEFDTEKFKPGPDKRVKILWTARFIGWKHPEMMLKLATYLLHAGINNFVIYMIGDGQHFAKIAHEVDRLKLNQHINLLGAIANDKVINLMQESEIFCFTSDKNEGWGAVLNEAMASACCVVANREIGSAPYLIENGENGYIYDTPDELFKLVKYLITNPDKCKLLGIKAHERILNVWSPANAAKNLLLLAESLLSHDCSFTIEAGPCSKA